MSLTISASPAVEAFLTWFLSQVTTPKQLDRIEAKLGALENHMSLIDDKIAAFKTATDAQFATLSTSLDGMAAAQANIAADEAGILAQLKLLQDLSPENQAILDGVLATVTSVASKSADQAKSLQDLADSIPDATPPAA